MWETPFEESMLGLELIVRCTDEALAKEFMEILERYGVVWNATRKLPTSHSNWYDYKRNTCYWIESKLLSFGDVRDQRIVSNERYTRYTKCTFYGKEEPTFKPADDSEMRSFLGF